MLQTVCLTNARRFDGSGHGIHPGAGSRSAAAGHRCLTDTRQLSPADIIATSRMPERSYFARATEQVARDLLGTILVRDTRDGLLAGRIVETEAYLGQGDQAAHSSAGPTPRTKVIFGAPGHAYVYRIYGMYCCLNVIVEPDGIPGCVLIRAVEPLAGIDRMRSHRPAARRVADLANGPGKLTTAFSIGMDLYGADLLDGPLTIRVPDPRRAPMVRSSRRIGISKSEELDLRFFIADNEYVSK